MEHADINKILMETGYIGAFYGLRSQADAIFQFYQMPQQSYPNRTAALLGTVMLLIGKSEYDRAAEKIEKFIQSAEQAEQEIPAEVKVFLALVYKKAKKHSDRASHLLEEVSQLPKETYGVAHHAAQQLANA
jgi:putative cell wall-binding protein